MKGDPGSTYVLNSTDVSKTGDVADSPVIDHALYPTCSFFLRTKSVGTSFDAKLQYSDNGTDWTDDDGASGNDDAITQVIAADAVKEAQIDVPNPRARYSKLVCTSVGAVVAMCFSVAGPKRHNSPA